ncbi:unnamed protein product [Clonostachys solani]|uniref:IBR domain-containing protein n=1 Tax=Clonostachys solani TaxID=160281 RepID=A0A9N9ZL10_9HYPO|nr:unnamed protein product [Clonostachys solani]
MSCADPPLHLDDESLALHIQLKEVQGQREHQSGKWVEGNPPDYAMAFEMFENEVNEAIALVQDMRLAHSIAMAVDSDAVAIELLAAEEARIAQDREYALSLDEDGGPAPRNNATNLDVLNPRGEVIDWDFVFESAAPVVKTWATNSTVAGPSGQYVHHQQAALQGLPNIKVGCIICGDDVPPWASVQLECEDIYCRPCLRAFFLQAAKDESLFPPRCHRQPIDLSIVESDLSIDELNMYKEAEAEFSSIDRVYCAVPECAKYIPAMQRNPDFASCGACGVETCMYCKGLAHEGACPDDEVRQSLLRFGKQQGWQSCSRCGQMVHRYEGCDHMTSPRSRTDELSTAAGAVTNSVIGVAWSGNIAHAAIGNQSSLTRGLSKLSTEKPNGLWLLLPVWRAQHRAADTVVRFAMVAITSISSHVNVAIYWHAKTAGATGSKRHIMLYALNYTP